MYHKPTQKTESAIGPKDSLRTGLPGLKIDIKSLQLPDTVVTRRTVESKRNGKVTNEKVTCIPFAATIKVSLSSDAKSVKALGLKENPCNNIALTLGIKNENGTSQLEMKLSSTYKVRQRYKKAVEVPIEHSTSGTCDSLDSNGSESYSWWGRETKYVSSVRTLRKRETLIESPISQNTFNSLYLAILDACASDKRTSLIDFLHQRYPKCCEVAQGYIKEKLYAASEQTKTKRAQNTVELTKEAQRLETLVLPRIRRVSHEKRI